LKNICDILLERQLITSTDAKLAKIMSRETGGGLEVSLIRLGAVSEMDLLDGLSTLLEIPIIAEDLIPNDPSVYHRAIGNLQLSASWLHARSAAIWQKQDDNEIHLISANILDSELREVIDDRCKIENLTLKTYLSGSQSQEMAMAHIVNSADDTLGANGLNDDDAARLREMAEEAPVIDFVNRVFSIALRDNASDIHIEPFEHKFQIRYRIDGVLHLRQTDSRARFDAVVSRIKLLSGMDIAERRLPQDGRQSVRFSGQDIDLRVSSVPGSWGESLVLRLLRKENELPDLTSLGLEGRSQETLKSLLNHPNGVILVTGPTGSGKSTTLYRSLQGINDGIRKIITIEDPVEYDMEGVVQIQINSSIGYTFAKGLRAILRQDPDVIMVGEIRDVETASIAAQAALTGHLVLSTLHTNSSLAAVARLQDIGLEPYMIVSAVRGFAAQRLVRRLCPNCSTAIKNPVGEAHIWSMVENGTINPDRMKRKPMWRAAQGCNLCSKTGFLGRVAIFEVAKMDEKLSDAILKNSSLPNLTKAAKEQGFVSLLEDGIMKARDGKTTLSEVFRVCGGDLSSIELEA